MASEDLGPLFGRPSRSGRQVKFTEKMLQNLEHEIRKTELEITKAEEQLRTELSSIRSSPNVKTDTNKIIRTEQRNVSSSARGSHANARPNVKVELSNRTEQNVVSSTPKVKTFKVSAPFEDQFEEQIGYFPDVRPRSVETKSDSSDNLERLVKLLANRSDKLPRMEPEVFSGDMLTFTAWLRSFETLIETQTDSPQDRLYYLGKYTTGDAKNCIRGYFTIDGPNTFELAKNTLIQRYGDKYKLGDKFKTEINDWPAIKSGDGIGLRKFVDFLQHCDAAMASIKYLQCLNTAEENRKMVAKLPRYLADRWSRIVDTALYSTADGEYPSLHNFCEFLSTEARILCGPGNVTNTSHTQKAKTGTGKPQAGSFTSSSETPHCFACQGNHYLQDCNAFLKMNTDERKKLVKAKGLCYGCLRRGHLRADCKRKGRQLVYAGLPPPNQNRPNQPPTETASATSHKTIITDNGNDFHSLIVPVVLHSAENPNQQMRTYALLDNQSNACFAADGVMERLGIKPEKRSLKLTTLLGSETLNSGVVRGLVIRGINESTEIVLPDTYTRDSIPVDKNLIPRRETLKAWPHLQHLAEKLEPVDSALEIGLLIGFNCSAALLPREIVASGDNEPYGVKTALGWSIVGPTKTSSSSSSPNPKFAFRTHVKEVTPSMVSEIFNKEYNESSSTSKPYSVEDTNFMQQMKTEVHQNADGHFELPLPFKGEQEGIPNNKATVLKRFNGLRAKLVRDEKYRNDYCKFMHELIENGHCEKVPIYDVNKKPVWYIPHHGIYHPRKPDKLRVVFDCSAEYMGHSLNKHLLQGPDMTNNLAGVLCRFRQEKVAVVCDIEKMFYQVRVNPDHQDYLRFLWTDNFEETPSEYRMTVHLFGATSSPGAANFALKMTADRYEEEYGRKSAEFVRRNFYVDDGVTSVSTPEEAVELVQQTRELCKRGGFNLHKFACTDKSVLKEIPAEIQAKELQNLDFKHDALPVSRTLGMEWSLEEDHFQFTVATKESPTTRRGILSVISSIYDPLGLVSPVILTGRKILQQICRDGNEWDDPVPSHVEEEWIKWKGELPLLKNLHIRRCYKPEDMIKEATVELHHYSDASCYAYGQCSYLRITDTNGKISTSLVMAKSRVAPSKPTTIPRLELMAATLSVKVAKFLHEELDYPNLQHVFWSDSKVVLGYIANDSRRFHVFVANRIQQIRDFTHPSQWHYVKTTENPADLASRGIAAGKLAENDLWWNGPPYLRSNPVPTEPMDLELSSEDPEVKKPSVLKTHVSVAPKTVPERLTAFSSWYKACRAVAVCLRLLQRLKEKTAKRKGNRKPYTPVTVEEIRTAEKTIIKLVQQEAFSKEIKTLRANKQQISKESKIHRLDPFLCKDGTLRVGGRVKRASLNFSAIHPMIIPKDSYLAQLIIAHYHDKYAHPGSNNTLSQVRMAGFWIVNGRSQVSKYVQKCVTCRKLRGLRVQQKMADLPTDRLEPCPPFTYSAVDVFGPFMIKENRSEKKRWCAIFVCMASRAIHMEVINSLSTDSFINAYRRFVCRRGPVRMLRSDRGTNFIGAKNQFDEIIRQKLSMENCDYCEFKLNFPHSSHMGGSWERMIRSARNSLSALLVAHPGRMDDELLRTLFVEVEAIVNSRPLTYYNTDDLTQEPLTPMQILTLKSKVVMPPPGNFVKEDVYCRKRWRQVQYMANQFWQRWIKNFLPTLQERRKWQQEFPNIEIGDIVIAMDDSVARSEWPKGRVTAVYPSEDGYVRKVSVKIKDTVFERPVQKLILLFRP